MPPVIDTHWVNADPDPGLLWIFMGDVKKYVKSQKLIEKIKFTNTKKSDTELVFLPVAPSRVAVLCNGLRRQGRKQLLFPEPEEEYKQREVCSPDFFKNLNAKYQAEKKERDGDDFLPLELKNFIVKIRCFRFESTSASSLEHFKIYYLVCSKSYMDN